LVQPSNKKFTTIPNHAGDMPEGTLKAILKQAGIHPDDFLMQGKTKS
jgi:predicted RNA binding protein YcfA (HicA-like mRNA interferase family)